MLSAGALIAKRYEVLRPIGQGGLAAAYLVRDRASERELALKLVPTASLDALRREFSTLRGLHHPHLCAVHDFGIDRNVAYYTADFVAGPTLDEHAASSSSFLDPFLDAVTALAFLHELGIRHGDFKPDNVRVDADGRGVLLDLSCAAPIGEAGPLAGTPRYFAPELLRGEPADQRADLYAAGITLREIASTERSAAERGVAINRGVWGGFPPRVIAGGAMTEIVDRLTASDRRDRPHDAQEALALLGRARDETRSGRARRLFAREGEMRELASMLDALIEERAGVRAIAITGPRGIGRSRLATEMKWTASMRTDVEVIEVGAIGPHPFRSMLGAASDAGDPGAGLDAALRCAEELARRDRPLVMVMDDLHESADAELARAVLRRVRRSDRTLWIVTSIDPLIDAHEGIRSMALAPLDDEHVARWVEEASVDARTAADVRARSGGFPGTIEALLARGSARGRGRPEDGDAWRALAAIALAGSIDASTARALGLTAEILWRLSREGWARRTEDGAALACPAEREMLIAEIEPSLARELSARIADASLGRDPASIARRIEQLARAGRIDEAERALSEADDAHAAALLRAADALFDASDEANLRAAEIHEMAGRPERALSLLAALLRRRPEAAMRARVHERAARTFLKLGRAKRALRESASTERSAERRVAMQNGGSGGVSPPEMIARADESTVLADLRSRALRQLGRYRESLDEARKGLAAADEVTRALLHEDIGIAATYLGEHELAREHLEAAVGRADPRSEVRAQSYLAILATREGRLDEAITRHRAALRIAEHHELYDQLASASSNLGAAYQQHGDLGPALDAYERALRLATALGKESSRALFNLATVLVAIGARERAERTLAECRALPGSPHLAGSIELCASEIELVFGDRARARAALDRARTIFEREALVREQLEARLCEAELELGERRTDRAERALDRADELSRTTEAPDLAARLCALRGRLALALGRAGEAIVLLEEALRAANQNRLQQAEIEAWLARACDAAGAPSASEAHRAAARALLERIAAALPSVLRDAFFSHPARRDVRAPQEQTTTLDLRRFLEVNKRLNSQLSVERILEHAMDAAIELTRAERGFVLLSSGEGTLEVRVARNLDRERIGRSHLKFSRSIAERVIETDEALLTTDATSDERFRENASVHAMQLRSVLCVPIRSPDGTLGALYLDHRWRSGSFGRDEVELLQIFGDQVAIALRNARQLDELTTKKRELEARSRELEVEKARVEELLRGRELVIEKLNEEVRVRQRVLERRYDYGKIVGRGPAMRAVLDALDRIIDTPISVVIEGESGTGKELVARAIHFNGPHKEGPFVSVNCAALPETLLESELFGHARGAFTGADRDREGLFVRASGGTLFLDEIGDTSAAMQVKLLRVLQEREVRPLGSSAVVPIDARILAATNRVLSEEVRSGRFRADLYYRIGVVEVRLPPLRERLEDLSDLTRAVLARVASDSGRKPPHLAPDLVSALAAHPWPGNVRELENALTRAYVMSDGKTLHATDLALGRATSSATTREEYEREESERILAALHAHRWNVRAVCRQLGIPSNTLYRKLKRYRIQRPTEA